MARRLPAAVNAGPARRSTVLALGSLAASLIERAQVRAIADLQVLERRRMSVNTRSCWPRAPLVPSVKFRSRRRAAGFDLPLLDDLVALRCLGSRYFFRAARCARSEPARRKKGASFVDVV